MEKLKGKIVGLDTMIFIYHFEENQAYSPLTFSIFESLEKGNFKGITSILNLLEILVKPKKENNSLLTERYKLLFETFPNLQVKTLNENIADIASGLRTNYNINTPDAIQMATSPLFPVLYFFPTNQPTEIYILQLVSFSYILHLSLYFIS